MGFCFPHHNGHPAWQYLSETVEDAAIEDLFWRKMQTDSVFTKMVIKAMWPDANEGPHELIIAPDLAVSLSPESHGAYAGPYPCNLNYLHGNKNDHEHIALGIQNSQLGGYYTGHLIAQKKGWLLKNVVHNLMQEDFLHDLKPNLKTSDRYHLCQKGSCYQQILMDEVPAYEKMSSAIERAYPFHKGFSQWNVYWYRTEDGRIVYGIIRFTKSVCNQYKLPISAWKQTSNIRCSTIVYDTLNVAQPYPLYNLDRVVTFPGSYPTVICSTEAYVDYTIKDHGWLSNYIPVTAYSSLVGTDWSKINGRTPIIFPEASTSGCYEAFRLHAILKKLGFQPRFIKRQKDAESQNIKLDQDLMSGMGFSNYGCSFPEFAEHCQREFGVQPPDGVLPKAVPLSSLPEPDIAQESLMAGLLYTEEQMMIYAWRGVGKSQFSMLLGLCFASGKSALNSRIHPSRKYRVLLLDGELPAGCLEKRAHALCRGHALPLGAMEDLKVRSPIIEHKALELETDAGFAELEPDMIAADIIIVDPVFKFFPKCMGSDFAGAEGLLAFLSWCRKHQKTLVLIDHEGKKRGTPFGTMAKEIGLDVILQLCKSDSDRWIKVKVKKARNHAEPSGAYIELRIHSSEKDESICFQVRNEHEAKTILEEESLAPRIAAESLKSLEECVSSRDEAIINYICEHPYATQKEITYALTGKGYGGPSTLQARIKKLSEAGKLPEWKNRTKSHKVTEQPAPVGDET